MQPDKRISTEANAPVLAVLKNANGFVVLAIGADQFKRFSQDGAISLTFSFTFSFVGLLFQRAEQFLVYLHDVLGEDGMHGQIAPGLAISDAHDSPDGLPEEKRGDFVGEKHEDFATRYIYAFGNHRHSHDPALLTVAERVDHLVSFGLRDGNGWLNPGYFFEHLGEMLGVRLVLGDNQTARIPALDFLTFDEFFVRISHQLASERTFGRYCHCQGVTAFFESHFLEFTFAFDAVRFPFYQAFVGFKNHRAADAMRNRGIVIAILEIWHNLLLCFV